MVEHVGSGNQAVEARGILDDRHQSTAQLCLQFRQAGSGGQGLQFVGHGAGHGFTEVRNVFMHPQQDVGLVDHADQFNNPANPLAHECSTAPEIWAQTQHDVDAIVVGVGSAGTLTGLTRFFKRVQPDLEMVLADPVGSVMAEYSRSGTLPTPGSWAVEGIGEDFIPSVSYTHLTLPTICSV